MSSAVSPDVTPLNGAKRLPSRAEERGLPGGASRFTPDVANAGRKSVRGSVMSVRPLRAVPSPRRP